MCVTFSVELVEELLQLACRADQGEAWKEEVLEGALMVVQKVDQVEKMVGVLKEENWEGT